MQKQNTKHLNVTQRRCVYLQAHALPCNMNKFPQVIIGEVPRAVSRGTQISPCSLDTGLK